MAFGLKKMGVSLAALSTALTVGAGPAWSADGAVLDPGTRLYLTLDENVTSARGGSDVGAVVRCRVWRDVESEGVTFIKAGTPATCRVDKVSRRNMGGTEGKVSVGGVETRSVDGQNVMLSGGYNKEGSGHKAVVWTVGLLLFWPALFVPGGNAELPPGTVIDVETVNALRLEGARQSPRVLDLRNLTSGFTAEFMLDDFIKQPKHDTFRIKVAQSGELPKDLVIDNVNGKPVTPIPLKLTGVTKDGDLQTGVAEADAKTVIKNFQRGINRFEVAYSAGGERKAAEVVMDVQM